MSGGATLSGSLRATIVEERRTRDAFEWLNHIEYRIRLSYGTGAGASRSVRILRSSAGEDDDDATQSQEGPLRSVGTLRTDESVLAGSVWKRFSDLAELHASLTQIFGLPSEAGAMAAGTSSSSSSSSRAPTAATSGVNGTRNGNSASQSHHAIAMAQALPFPSKSKFTKLFGQCFSSETLLRRRLELQEFCDEVLNRFFHVHLVLAFFGIQDLKPGVAPRCKLVPVQLPWCSSDGQLLCDEKDGEAHCDDAEHVASPSADDAGDLLIGEERNFRDLLARTHPLLNAELPRYGETDIRWLRYLLRRTAPSGPDADSSPAVVGDGELGSMEFRIWTGASMEFRICSCQLCI